METSICLLKEEVVEFAGRNFFKEAIIQLTPEKFICRRENINSITILLDYTSRYIRKTLSKSRLQELKRNIAPFRLPTNFTNHIQLDAIGDPRLPKQMAEELARREDVLEGTFFSASYSRRRKEEYRIKLKFTNFGTFIFHTLS